MSLQEFEYGLTPRRPVDSAARQIELIVHLLTEPHNTGFLEVWGPWATDLLDKSRYIDAPGVFQEPAIESTSQAIADFVRDNTNPASALLEVGAGAGQFSRLIQKIVPDYIATEIHPKGLQYLRRDRNIKGPDNPDGVIADARLLPFPDGSFTHLLSIGSFDVLAPHQLELAAAESNRVLRPGGEVLFTLDIVPGSGWARGPNDELISAYETALVESGIKLSHTPSTTELEYSDVGGKRKASIIATMETLKALCDYAVNSVNRSGIEVGAVTDDQKAQLEKLVLTAFESIPEGEEMIEDIANRAKVSRQGRKRSVKVDLSLTNIFQLLTCATEICEGYVRQNSSQLATLPYHQPEKNIFHLVLLANVEIIHLLNSVYLSEEFTNNGFEQVENGWMLGLEVIANNAPDFNMYNVSGMRIYRPAPKIGGPSATSRIKTMAFRKNS